ncbi:MAG: metallophosphoesterase [Myxococcota bacterium]
MLARRLAAPVLALFAFGFNACLADDVGGVTIDAIDASGLDPLDATTGSPDVAAPDAVAPDVAAPDAVAPDVAMTETVATEDTTAVVADTTVAPEDTAVAPEDATVAPDDTTAPPDDTTAPPDDTTVPPDDTTAPPDDTTVPPDDTTAPPDDTTALPDDAVTGPEPLPPADAGQLSAPPYLMWVTTSEVSVRWETKTAVIGRVDYGPTDALAMTLEEDSARTTHELRLTGLPAAQLIGYRVVYGGGALPVRHFHTAPLEDDPDFGEIRFVVWADNQDGPQNFVKLVGKMGAFDPDFAVSAGDTVQYGTRDLYRSQMFGPLAGFADQVPFLVAAGNHERYTDGEATLFDEYYSQPGDEHCFGWRYGELFMLFLDTDLGLDGPTGQRACIEAALTSPEALGATIQAAAFHKPPRIEYWFGGILAFPDDMKAPWVHDDLEPLLESLGVDLVFNGHNHLYAYTPPITTGGITWVTTGGGGGMLDTPGFLNIWRVGNWPEIKTTISEFHFLQVTVEAGEAFVEAIGTDGSVLHSFYAYGD